MISVITISFNSSKTIKRTLNSILSQKIDSKYEYIVVDGDSTDGTKEILIKYEKLFFKKNIRYRWISEKDAGIYDAMNKGIKMANGDIIGILNSDDYYENNTLRVVEEAAKEESDAGVIYGFLRVVDEKENEIVIYRYRYENYLLERSTGVESAAQHPACFIKKNVYDRIGLYDTRYHTAADYDFLIRAMKAGVRYYAVNEILTNFRKGGLSEKISNHEKSSQRWDIQYRNGLMTSEEYNKNKKITRYQQVSFLKQKVIKLFFGKEKNNYDN